MGGRHSSVVSSATTILRTRVRIPCTTSPFFEFVIELGCENDEIKPKEAGIRPNIFSKK